MKARRFFASRRIVDSRLKFARANRIRLGRPALSTRKKTGRILNRKTINSGLKREKILYFLTFISAFLPSNIASFSTIPILFPGTKYRETFEKNRKEFKTITVEEQNLEFLFSAYLFYAITFRHSREEKEKGGLKSRIKCWPVEKSYTSTAILRG